VENERLVIFGLAGLSIIFSCFKIDNEEESNIVSTPGLARMLYRVFGNLSSKISTGIC
jgi:hypothetical protein